MKKKAAQGNKEYQARRLSEADVEAERQARELLAELNAKTDGEMSELEKRIAGAVKVILESL